MSDILKRIEQAIFEHTNDFRIPLKVYLGRKEYRAVRNDWKRQLQGTKPNVRSVRAIWTSRGLAAIVSTKHASYLRVVSTIEAP